VQSSTLLLMACEGELRIDAAIFADTGWEPKSVYEHLAWLEVQAATAGIPVYRVGSGDIRERELARHYTWMPLRMKGEAGNGLLRRQCTDRYKIRPIQRKLRELGAKATQPIDLLIGISLDEYQRMRDSQVKYQRNVYPLIERRMSREACLVWMRTRGYPEPGKSSCIGCPYHDNAHWRRLRDTSPDEWADAVDFDERIRHAYPKLSGEAFLHRSLVPLAEADLRSEQDRGQSDMLEMLSNLGFPVESDGCGVLCPADDAV
jgi:hypothetical protein